MGEYGGRLKAHGSYEVWFGNRVGLCGDEDLSLVLMLFSFCCYSNDESILKDINLMDILWENISYEAVSQNAFL